MSTRLPVRVGRYRIEGLLGRGAMGAVYRARDPQLDREVAVKMISNVLGAGEATTTAEVEGRFEREARLAARLHHPNVVTVFDAGREGEDLFLVLEMVEGESLGARLARGEFPSAPAALEISAEVADALAAAHAAGIIHRDIKPGNILLSRDGRVKVSDFGVAKAIGESTDLTRSGMMVGSPAYMAPEQVKGAKLDGRSDLFSLGVVLYEMLLRRKPFPADTVTSLVYQILHEDPCADPRTTTALGAGVAELLRDALAKDPAARIPDAATFARRARSLAGAAFAPTAALPAAHAVAAAPPAPAPPARIPLPPTEATRTPSAAAGKGWIVAAILGGLAVLGVLGLLLRRPAPPPVESPEPARAATSVPGAGNPIAIQPATPRVEKRERAAPEPAPPVAPAAAPATAPAAPAAGNDRAAAPAATPAATESAPPAATTGAGAEPVVWSDMPVGEVFTVSRGAEFHVDPDKAIVAVAGKVLGKADDWDGSGGGKTYYFPGPGVYVARFALPGYRTVYVKFVVRPDATTPIANVDTELEEVK